MHDVAGPQPPGVLTVDSLAMPGFETSAPFA